MNIFKPRPLFDSRKISKMIQIHLISNGVVLRDNDVVAGGMVRDIMLGKSFSDVDVYSPTSGPHDNRTDILFRTTETLSDNISIQEIDHENFQGRNYIYNVQKLTIDHKFYDPTGPYMKGPDIAKLFRCSICQITYNIEDGVYMSEDFLKTMHTKVITFDTSIPNWNDSDGKGKNHHALKMKAKFNEFEVNVAGSDYNTNVRSNSYGGS